MADELDVAEGPDVSDGCGGAAAGGDPVQLPVAVLRLGGISYGTAGSGRRGWLPADDFQHHVASSSTSWATTSTSSSSDLMDHTCNLLLLLPAGFTLAKGANLAYRDAGGPKGLAHADPDLLGAVDDLGQVGDGLLLLPFFQIAQRPSASSGRRGPGPAPRKPEG